MAVTGWHRRGLLLFALMVVSGAWGCGSRDSDASDSDPNYYKGKTFHGRNSQKPGQ